MVSLLWLVIALMITKETCDSILLSVENKSVIKLYKENRKGNKINWIPFTFTLRSAISNKHLLMAYSSDETVQRAFFTFTLKAWANAYITADKTNRKNIFGRRICSILFQKKVFHPQVSWADVEASEPIFPSANNLCTFPAIFPHARLTQKPYHTKQSLHK